MMRSMATCWRASLLGPALSLCLSCAPPPILADNLEPIAGCGATDGDTIRCGEERIRIIGIDAPEKGSCRPGRQCVEGDPIRATETLAAELRKALAIERMGQDRYGRTLGHVYADGRSIACTQIAVRSAQYMSRWDNLPRGRVRSECDIGLMKPASILVRRDGGTNPSRFTLRSASTSVEK